MAKKVKASEVMSTADIGHFAENEGLGYTIMYCLSPEKIEDEKLAKLVKQAQDNINQIDIMLKEALKNENERPYDPAS